MKKIFIVFEDNVKETVYKLSKRGVSGRITIFLLGWR